MTHRKTAGSAAYRICCTTAVLSIAAVVAAWPTAGQAQPATGTPIPVGLSAPLTTQFASDGRFMREGVELAIKEINAAAASRDGRSRCSWRTTRDRTQPRRRTRTSR